MRRWPDAALAGALVVLAVVGAFRWVDTTLHQIVVLQTAGPFVLVGLVLLAALTALMRRWWLFLAVAAAVVVSLAMAVPTYFSSASPRANKDLTVMAAALKGGDADGVQVMDAVRARAVDVLVLTEVTPDAVEALRANGLDEHFTASAGEARVDSVHGTLIYSRYPLAVPDAVPSGSASLQPEVIVAVNGTRVRIKAVHVTAPLAGQTATWRAELSALRDWREGAEPPFLLAGDFNADTGHPSFRALAEGTRDANRVAGLGWVRTWPVVGQRLPPYVQLDHLLSSGLTVVEAGQVAVHGTDHAIVWSSYAVTTAG